MSRYPCCPDDDEQPCPQAATGHDLPCNGPACWQLGRVQQPIAEAEDVT
jgi:hypothetical protein